MFSTDFLFITEGSNALGEASSFVLGRRRHQNEGGGVGEMVVSSWKARRCAAFATTTTTTTRSDCDSDFAVRKNFTSQSAMTTIAKTSRNGTIPFLRRGERRMTTTRTPC